MNKRYNEGGLLNEFNAGGTHEENPNGGIPVGENGEGGFNLTQERETQYQDYIFSDDVKLDKATAKQLFIDPKYVGKTMAEISKRLNAPLEDRPWDKIMKGTVSRELDKLIMANEQLKPQPKKENLTLGGYTIDSANPSDIGRREDAVDSAGDITKVKNTPFFGGGGMGSMFSMMGKGGGNNGGTQDAHNLKNEYGENMYAGAENEVNAQETVKDKVGEVGGGFFALFRGIQKAGTSAGEAIGGDVGGGVSSFFSPSKTGVTVAKRNDTNFGQKLLGWVPGVGGVVKSKFEKADREEAQNEWIASQNQARRESDFKKGGFLNTKFDKGGHTHPHPDNGYNEENQISAGLTQDTTGIDTVETTDKKQRNRGEWWEKFGNNIDKYGNDALRLAPIARNLFKKAPEATITSFPRLDSRFKKAQMDRAAMFNRINTASGNTREAIYESSGGDLGAVRKNILQANINELRAISNSLFQNDSFEAQQGNLEQTFNKDTDTKNLDITMAETIANEQNRAAATLYKDTMRNAAWEDIGLLGRENKLARVLSKTTGYSVDGDKTSGFLSDLIRKKSTTEEEKALLARLEKKYR